jgi:hypothetical protein
MLPEHASSLPPAAEEQSAEVVPLRSLSRAPAEELETSPPQKNVVMVGADVDESRPPPDTEITEAVRRLRGAHPKSPDEVRRYACQLPSSVFAAALEEVQEAEADGSARRPVGLLIYRLRVELDSRAQQFAAALAGDASERFGYGAPSPTDELRHDPERWVRAMAPRVTAGDVESYLRLHVADELQRHRLRSLADESRAR